MYANSSSSSVFRDALCLVPWVRDFRNLTERRSDRFRSIIGAAIGGALADPVKNYPENFNPHGLFERFPYLLPNLVCTGVVVFGLLVGILFLEESHEDKKYRKDIGLEFGQKIIGIFKRASKAEIQLPIAETKETDLVLPQDEKRLSYQSTDSAPTSIQNQPLDVDTAFECESECTPIPTTSEKLSWRQGFSRQVMLIIIGYGILALYVSMLPT